MVTKIKYVIVKKDNYKNINQLKINNVYDMTSKTPIKGGINVTKINLIDETFIEKMINKRINKRFKSLLELIASICESDEDPTTGLRFALDETEKFKREMLNKYARLLKKKEKELIDKKIDLIEKDVKKRLLEHQVVKSFQQKMQQEMYYHELEEVELKENHRRR